MRAHYMDCGLLPTLVYKVYLTKISLGCNGLLYVIEI